MRKIILIIMLAALSVADIAAAQTKTGTIPTGYTSLSKPMLFTAADSIAGRGGSFIVTSDSLVIVVTNLQKYLQHQTITTSLVKHSGTPSVVITLRGRVTSSDNWHPIGTPITWETAANNPATITSTVPLGYNYLKVSYVASGATQCVQVTAFEIKTSNVYDVGKVSAMVLGDGSGTIAVNSSDWDISTTGVQTGMGAITSNGLITTTAGLTVTGAAVNLNASSNFATNINTGSSSGALSLGGGSGTVAVSSTGWSVTTTGAATFGSYTIANGIGRVVTTATSSADSTAAGSKLAAVDQFVTITSGGATRTITLPAAGSTTIGLTIEGYVAGNGFDLRVAGAQALTVKINDVTGADAKGVEAAIPATTKFRVVCVSATEWNLTALDELGAVITAIVPSTIQKR